MSFDIVRRSGTGPTASVGECSKVRSSIRIGESMIDHSPTERVCDDQVYHRNIFGLVRDAKTLSKSIRTRNPPITFCAKSAVDAALARCHASLRLTSGPYRSSRGCGTTRRSGSGAKKRFLVKGSANSGIGTFGMTDHSTTTAAKPSLVEARGRYFSPKSGSLGVISAAPKRPAMIASVGATLPSFASGGTSAIGYRTCSFTSRRTT
jgi:hypothetical protein